MIKKIRKANPKSLLLSFAGQSEEMFFTNILCLQKVINQPSSAIETIPI
jgi:hypothetical protein